jgi:crossover junction endodeoxyribonuclease RuvC
MIIFGIDPGYDRVGFAIVSKTGNKEEIVFSECFITNKKESLDSRIFAVGNRAQDLIETYKPDVMAIEDLFFAANKKTVMGVSQARGVLKYAAFLLGVEIWEYTPLEIKAALTGYGKASKADVEFMARKLISFPQRDMIDDEVDAIAVALTAHARAVHESIHKK